MKRRHLTFRVVLASLLLPVIYLGVADCSLYHEVKEVHEMPSKATWNGKVIAETNDVVVVEGNKYFPMGSLKMEYFQKCNLTSVCPWKGTANYFDIIVDGKTNPSAAWYYPTPKPDAMKIKDHVAFWKGVNVS